jgi:poly(glycerol-phosphate) alpha-glucosyltransferase
LDFIKPSQFFAETYVTQPPSRKLLILTSSLSRASGGLFDAVRGLAFALAKSRRYLPFAAGLRDSHTDLDQSLWGDIETKAFDVLGPRAFGYSPGLRNCLTDKNPDILHVHGLWMYPSVVATAWSGNQKPYIVSPHGMLDPWALNNSRWKKRISALLYENRHLRGACCIHALNHAEAESVRAYGLKNPICIIPNGVELPPLTGQRTSQSTHTLLYLGRLHPKKGLPKLLEAWSLVQKEANNSRWRLVIAGWDQNGHQRDLEKLAAMLNIGSSISFVGPMFGEAKAASFSGASAFILPSLSEGLPMTVLEAWSWGLPVLMTPKCNLPEGEANGAAIMMEADADSISAALLRLLRMNDHKRGEMGMNGRHLVEKRFQWPRIAQQMADVYDWVLGGSRPYTMEIWE